MTIRLMFLTALAVFALDQASKLIVVHLLDLKTLGAIQIFPPYLNFRMAWNQGVNFGLFSSGSEASKWILVAIAVVISTWVAVWIGREHPGKIGQISAGMLIGGAMGNVIDRLIYGAVADFLNMSCCGIDNPFAFNIADISIFIGALGLILFTGRQKSE